MLGVTNVGSIEIDRSLISVGIGDLHCSLRLLTINTSYVCKATDVDNLQICNGPETKCHDSEHKIHCIG